MWKAERLVLAPGLASIQILKGSFNTYLRDTSTPMVIDADAINILANNKVWIRYIPDGSILTPHPKELERLIGPWKNDMDKFARVKLFCKNNDVLVVIKGAHTAVVDSVNTIFFNSTGNPGMATGGSGDVLTGIITGLLSQGYSSSHAAIVRRVPARTSWRLSQCRDGARCTFSLRYYSSRGQRL